MNDKPELIGVLYRLVELVVPDLWRALPAAVLALLAFGFRRMARRFLGLFEKLDQVENKLDDHLSESGMIVKQNEEAHRNIVKMIEDHARESMEGSARVERALEAQARRIDDLSGRRS